MDNWRDLPEGFYAVPDPRPGVEDAVFRER